MAGMRATMLGLLAAVALALPPAYAQEPFYKGKRLSVLVNYAPGGPTDIEGRLFARHMASISTASRRSSCRTSRGRAA